MMTGSVIPVSVRATAVTSTTVTVDLPYGATLDTSSGDHQLAMPLSGAKSMYWALKEVLASLGELENA